MFSPRSPATQSFSPRPWHGWIAFVWLSVALSFLVAAGCSDDTASVEEELQLNSVVEQQFGHLHDLRLPPPEKPQQISSSQELKKRREPQHDVEVPAEAEALRAAFVVAIEHRSNGYTHRPVTPISLNRLARRSGASRAPPVLI